MSPHENQQLHQPHATGRSVHYDYGHAAVLPPYASIQQSGGNTAHQEPPQHPQPSANSHSSPPPMGLPSVGSGIYTRQSSQTSSCGGSGSVALTSSQYRNGGCPNGLVSTRDVNGGVPHPSSGSGAVGKTRVINQVIYNITSSSN